MKRFLDLFLILAINVVWLPLQAVIGQRVGGMSTSGWRSTWIMNCEIVRGNREAGYFCCLGMMFPKYAVFKIWEFVLSRLRNGWLKWTGR